MGRVVLLLIAAVAGCSFDWTSLDPRTGTTTGGGSGGTVTTTTSSSPTTGGSGGTRGRDAVCGDSMVSGDEQCDDGNRDAGDGCVDCQVECVDGFVNPSTLRCYVVLLTSQDWQSAHDACLALGAGFDLVALSSQEEFDWFIAQPIVLNAIVGKALWTGGNDQLTEGVFVNANGEPWFDGVWGASQPDNFDANAGGGPPGPGEDCVEIFDEVLFNDLHCTASRYFGCERPPP